MRVGQSKGFETSTKVSQPMQRKTSGLQKTVYATIYDVTLGWILKKIWLSMQKLFVALKYQWHQRTGGWLEGRRLSWFKIGLAGIAVFIVLKKDIQFSINMKAPADKEQSAGVSPVRTRQVQELGVGNGITNLVGASTAIASVRDLEEQQVKNYIKRFSKVAQAEMQKYGVPASVKMGQAIIESWAGQQSVSTNNHFGVPLAGRTYPSAWESWRTHSVLLREQHATLFQNGKNYTNWAKGLQEAGYNADKNYADKLITVIEQYQLQLLDE